MTIGASCLFYKAVAHKKVYLAICQLYSYWALTDLLKIRIMVLHQWRSQRGAGVGRAPAGKVMCPATETPRISKKSYTFFAFFLLNKCPGQICANF